MTEPDWNRLKQEARRLRRVGRGNALLGIGTITALGGLSVMWIDLGVGLAASVVGFAVAIVGEEMTR